MIGASPAIQMPPSPGRGPYSNLVALEHAHLAISLFAKGRQPPCAVSWWQHQYHVDWAGEMQRQTRFRASRPDQGFVLYQADEDDPCAFTGSKSAVSLSWWRRAVSSVRHSYPPSGSPPGWITSQSPVGCAGQRAGVGCRQAIAHLYRDPSATQRAECQALAIRPAIRCV